MAESFKQLNSSFLDKNIHEYLPSSQETALRGMVFRSWCLLSLNFSFLFFFFNYIRGYNSFSIWYLGILTVNIFSTLTVSTGAYISFSQWCKINLCPWERAGALFSMCGSGPTHDMGWQWHACLAGSPVSIGFISQSVSGNHHLCLMLPYPWNALKTVKTQSR